MHGLGEQAAALPPEKAPAAAARRYDGMEPGHRDLDYIRQLMPIMHLMSRYHRVEARGFENIPRVGPALLVSNHNGGVIAQDVTVTMYEFYKRVGIETEAYGLVHPGMFKDPNLARHLVRSGGLMAAPKPAMRALRRGAHVLVYPGGGDDAYKTSDRRNEIVLAGRTGFVRLALSERVPIIPIVTCGAHDTLIVLNDGRALAERLGLSAKFGIERLPISLCFPWGLTIGPVPYLPTPAKIRIRVGKPIVFRGLGPAQAKRRDVLESCTRQVHQVMQSLLDDLVREERERSDSR